jgi:hypothetical protein
LGRHVKRDAQAGQQAKPINTLHGRYPFFIARDAARSEFPTLSDRTGFPLVVRPADFSKGNFGKQSASLKDCGEFAVLATYTGVRKGVITGKVFAKSHGNTAARAVSPTIKKQLADQSKTP